MVNCCELRLNGGICAILKFFQILRFSENYKIVTILFGDFDELKSPAYRRKRIAFAFVKYYLKTEPVYQPKRRRKILFFRLF